MELTNEQRKYLGLELIDPSWERMEIPNNSRNPELSTGKDVLFFDGDVLRKVIWLNNDGSFLENSYKLKTQDNRTIIAPLTDRGKPKRLTDENMKRCNPYGMYLEFGGGKELRGYVRIANYTTQQTYYSSKFAGIPYMNEEEFQSFLDKWITDTSPEDLAEIQAFAHAKRRHCKYREGDFFRFKYDRRSYGYGRILFDVRQFIKGGGKFLDILMGKPLCVSVYHIVTENPNVDMEELLKLKSFPSEYLMDNCFYYGEYEIIGNASLPENQKEIDFPIMYDTHGRNKICYCRGREYREIPSEGNVPVKGSFRNNCIGWTLYLNKAVAEECIKQESNAPYWRQKPKTEWDRDLRNPAYEKELEYVLKQMRR